MMNNPPLKGLNIRIPVTIPIKGRGFINQGSGLSRTYRYYGLDYYMGDHGSTRGLLWDSCRNILQLPTDTSASGSKRARTLIHSAISFK